MPLNKKGTFVYNLPFIILSHNSVLSSEKNIYFNTEC